MWSYGWIKSSESGEDIGMFTCKSDELGLHELHDQNCKCNPKVGILPGKDRLGYMVKHQQINK